VVDLIARTPADGIGSYSKGAATFEELTLHQIQSIAPFEAKLGAVETALGFELPKVGRSWRKAGQEVAWFSQGQFLAFDVDIGDRVTGLAAITDQSDAWCAIVLSGSASEAILARLVPLDLRESHFKRGHIMRSHLGHVPLHVTRLESEAFRLMTFRSMAGTMVHDLRRAMDLLAGRG